MARGHMHRPGEAGHTTATHSLCRKRDSKHLQTGVVHIGAFASAHQTSAPVGDPQKTCATRANSPGRLAKGGVRERAPRSAPDPKEKLNDSAVRPSSAL